MATISSYRLAENTVFRASEVIFGVGALTDREFLSVYASITSYFSSTGKSYKSHTQRKRTEALTPKSLILLVGGTGFEPVTPAV